MTACPFGREPHHQVIGEFGRVGSDDPTTSGRHFAPTLGLQPPSRRTNWGRRDGHYQVVKHTPRIPVGLTFELKTLLAPASGSR
jgi:hypothetical protein